MKLRHWISSVHHSEVQGSHSTTEKQRNSSLKHIAKDQILERIRTSINSFDSCNYVHHTHLAIIKWQESNYTYLTKTNPTQKSKLYFQNAYLSLL